MPVSEAGDERSFCFSWLSLYRPCLTIVSLCVLVTQVLPLLLNWCSSRECAAQRGHHFCSKLKSHYSWKGDLDQADVNNSEVLPYMGEIRIENRLHVQAKAIPNDDQMNTSYLFVKFHWSSNILLLTAFSCRFSSLSPCLSCFNIKERACFKTTA